MIALAERASETLATKEPIVHIWQHTAHAVCGSVDVEVHRACTTGVALLDLMIWSDDTHCKRCGTPICAECLIGCELEPPWDCPWI